MKFAAALLLFWFPMLFCSQNDRDYYDKHALEKAEIRRVAEPRPLMVLITADWCAYCRLMKKKIFSNPEVAGKLQADFYLAVLNGEFTEPIGWAGKTYRFSPSGLRTGTHELALHLGAVNGKLTYPTMVILDENNQVLYRYSGYLKSHELLELLGHFKK